MTDPIDDAPPAATARKRPGPPKGFRAQPKPPAPVDTAALAGAVASEVSAALAGPLAAIAAALQQRPTPEAIVPRGQPSGDPELDAGAPGIRTSRSAAERQPLREPIRQAHHDPHREGYRPSDAEILAMFDSEETDKYEFDDSIVPDGMTYGWVRVEVLGKPDPSNLAEYQRRGWRSVPAERHDGIFLPKGVSGPVIKDGLMLMEIAADKQAMRQRYWKLKARQAVIDKEAQLGYAPPGTGPRDHPRVRPTVRHSYEPLPME